MKRRGLAVRDNHTLCDWRQPSPAHAAVQNTWLKAWHDPRQPRDLHQLGEELNGLDDAFRLWRFRHMTTVERVISFKRGTASTGGAGCLHTMLDTALFLRIWRLRTQL